MVAIQEFDIIIRFCHHEHMKTKSGTHASTRQRLPRRRMERKATTFRLSADVQKRLELLRKLRKAPLNQLVNSAVDQYVTSALAEEEVNLTDTLQRIREARQSDRHFEAAIGQFVESEAALAAEDPVEGKVVDVQPRARRRKAARREDEVPAQTS
jgi:predicted transcriptional regulator